MNEALATIIGATVGVIIGVIIFSALLAYPAMLLWNGCMVPAVSVLNEVTWMQMWGINFLCSMLFKTTVTRKES